jgi:hypothetical protein
MAVFWVVALCNLVEVYRRVRRACCFHQSYTKLTTYKTAQRHNPEEKIDILYRHHFINITIQLH